MFYYCYGYFSLLKFIYARVSIYFFLLLLLFFCCLFVVVVVVSLVGPAAAPLLLLGVDATPGRRRVAEQSGNRPDLNAKSN